MNHSNHRGWFTWYDLMTSNMKGAEEFYPKVTGWSVENWRGGPMPYQLWRVGEVAVGGSMELPEEARAMGEPSQWRAHVGVADVDGVCRRVEELRGRVVRQPQNIPQVGRFAVIDDPQGAVLAIFSPGEDSGPGPQSPPSPGRFSWHELATNDLNSTMLFYTELFGWEETDTADLGEIGSYRMFGFDGHSFGGMFTTPDSRLGPPRWLFYVLVKDIEGAVTEVRQGGGTILNGPMRVPGGDLVAQCLDPQGAAFALHAKKA